MNILKVLNVVVRFLLELCMLAAVGYWGFKNGSGWGMKLVLGISLPALVAVGWRQAWKLRGASRLALELTLLGSGAVALFASHEPGVGWGYTVVAIINKVLMIVWKQ